jgi:proline iminopeptidase
MTHHYLLPLAELANYGYEIIFYDQSAVTDSYTIEYYINQLGEILDNLNEKEIHILGHSWGVALALLYVYNNPNKTNIKSLLLCSGLISTHKWCDSIRDNLLIKLPPTFRDVLLNNSDRSEIYNYAMDYFYRRHVHIIKDYDCILDSYKYMNKFVFESMWGLNEFAASPSSTLYNLDLTDLLPKIYYPIFIMCGEFDEAIPQDQRIIIEKCPYAKNSSINIVPNAAHMTFTDNFESSINYIIKHLEKL